MRCFERDLERGDRTAEAEHQKEKKRKHISKVEEGRTCTRLIIINVRMNE